MLTQVLKKEIHTFRTVGKDGVYKARSQETNPVRPYVGISRNALYNRIRKYNLDLRQVIVS